MHFSGGMSGVVAVFLTRVMNDQFSYCKIGGMDTRPRLFYDLWGCSCTALSRVISESAREFILSRLDTLAG